MIIKKRSEPIRLLQLRSLKRRIVKNHPSYPKILEELSLREAGYRGERSLDYHLRFLNGRNFKFFHDVHLKSKEGHVFQMDSIVLCPQFIAILEIKNIAGTIYFNETTKQMVRTLKDTKEVFPNPLIQLRRQRMQLTDWLLEHAEPLKPMIELVVFTNPSVVIESNHNNNQMLSRVTISEHLPEKLDQLQASYSVEKLTQNDLNRISTMLTTEQYSEKPPPLSSHQLTIQDIQTGINCPSCNQFSMKRIVGKWKCNVCHFYSKDAHYEALEDYFLLIKPTITNQELRSFLQVTSPTVSHHLLTQLKVPSVRKNKYTFYTLTLPITH